jgi:TolB-like protein
MKKTIFCFVLFIMALAGYTQELLVSVRDFTAKSGFSEDELEYITKNFVGILALTGEVIVVNWRLEGKDVIMDASEQRKQGLIDLDKVMKLGTGVGAKAIITGELMKLGSNNYINMSLLDAESGIMLSSTRRTYKDLDDFLDLLPSLANDIVKLLRRK